jgi:hypothetical protein
MKQETLEEFINSQPYYGCCTTEYLEGIEEGAKWKAERSYSEEDMKESWYNGMKSDNGFFGSFEEWFEQFKKK